MLSASDRSEIIASLADLADDEIKYAEAGSKLDSRIISVAIAARFCNKLSKVAQDVSTR